MFWVVGRRRALIASSGLFPAWAIVGCARPQGILFPPIVPSRVWPEPPERPRIKLIGMLNDSTDLKAAVPAGEAFRAALRGPRPPIRFSSPHGLAVRLDRVAVADGAGSAVHIIDLKRRTHRMVTGFGDTPFGAPLGVTWAGERLFVTDAQRHEVIELDARGGFRGTFGGEVLERPVGIAYGPQRDRLYVVDGGAHRLVVFSLEGAVITTLGRRGTGPGEFNFPTHICCAGDRLLVADSGNFRVQLLDVDGRSLAEIGHKGDAAGDLSLPKGVAFDRDGHIYVVDANFENVQIFDEAGRLLLAFGEEGDKAGEFSLPAGVAIDHQDRIWIADSGNRRLQLFAYIRVPS